MQSADVGICSGHFGNELGELRGRFVNAVLVQCIHLGQGEFLVKNQITARMQASVLSQAEKNLIKVIAAPQHTKALLRKPYDRDRQGTVSEGSQFTPVGVGTGGWMAIFKLGNTGIHAKALPLPRDAPTLECNHIGVLL